MLQCIFPSIEHGSLVQEWRDKSQEVLHHERHRSAWGAQDSLHEEKSVSWELPDTIKDSFHLRLHPVRKSGNIKNIQRTVVDGQGTPLFLEMSKYLDTRISCVTKDTFKSSLDNQLRHVVATCNPEDWMFTIHLNEQTTAGCIKIHYLEKHYQWMRRIEGVTSLRKGEMINTS